MSLGSGVGVVSKSKREIWAGFQWWIVDRSAAVYNTPEFYAMPIDRTAFSITFPLCLQQFDISKIYSFDLVKMSQSR